MNSSIHRTAIVVTVAAAAGAIAMILALVAAVSSGALRNPTMPLRASHPPEGAARSIAPVSPQLALETPPPAPLPAPSKVEVRAARPLPPEQTPAISATAAKSAKASDPQMTDEGNEERTLPEAKVSVVDHLAAVRLLKSTNGLPLVKVDFRPEDLLSLVRAGRGALIVGGGLSNRRELTVSIPGGDIQPLDGNAATRISRFRLPSGSLPLPPAATPLLQAIFPQGFDLEYGLSHSDAEDIVAKVIAAGRPHPDSIRPRLVYEGVLSVKPSGKVDFKVLRVGEREGGS